jgi:diadenosine tetraphosphate (Ap4A) HIT family hydrolase
MAIVKKPNSNCLFCNLPEERVLFSNEFGSVIKDAYPISIGHALIISKLHVGSLFQLDQMQQLELIKLIEIARGLIESTLAPDAYNVGINDGAEAGQTIPHLHIHLIPRYKNDQVDPRGGVRWIFPEKAKYW